VLRAKRQQALCGLPQLGVGQPRYGVDQVKAQAADRPARQRLQERLDAAPAVRAPEERQMPRLRGLRIGVPRVPFYDDLDPELAVVIAAALAKLHESGCILVEADMPDLAKLSAAAGAISYYEQSRDLDAYLRAAGSSLTTREIAAEIASPDVRAIFETDVLGATAVTAQAYREAIEQHRPRLQAAYASHFRGQKVAAIVLPTTVLPARPIGQDGAVELNGRQVPTFATFLRNTRVMTIAGIPGLSIPAGLTASGLPVGLEFDAPAATDRALLGIGMAVENVLGHLPPPPT
jgi:mandelamide amidase